MYRVLVVDDDIEILRFCKHALKNESIEVVTEGSSYRVLELIKVHRFNLVILDINLPGTSGIKLLEEIKANSPFHYPILMFTAKRTPKDVQSSIKLGAQDYLVKPLKIDVLQERISVHLESTEDVLSVQLEKPEKIELSLPDDNKVLQGEIIAINEYGLQIMTDFQLPTDTLITVKADFFESLIGVKLQSIKLTSIRCQKINEHQFKIQLSNINILNASMIDQIRVWCKKNYIEMKTVS